MDLWNDENPVTEHGIDVPAWIDQEISPSTVAAICQGGCASGAYMPAVTYHEALQTMTEHGDEVFDLLETVDNLMPGVVTSWAGLACDYLSKAVELWAYGVQAELEQLEVEVE